MEMLGMKLYKAIEIANKSSKNIEDYFDMESLRREIKNREQEYEAANPLDYNPRSVYKKEYNKLKKWEERNVLSRDEAEVLNTKISTIYKLYKQKDELTKEELFEYRQMMSEAMMIGYQRLCIKESAWKLKQLMYRSLNNPARIAYLVGINRGVIANLFNGYRDIKNVNTELAVKIAIAINSSVKDML